MTQRLPQRFATGLRVHHFHLRVPALDPVFQIDREDADVDGFDNVLVELLQPLEFGNLLLQPLVELRVLDGDADVSGERSQHLHVLAGEEVAVIGAAQADDRHGTRTAALAVRHAAGQVVVQVQQSGAALLRVRQTQNLLRILQEDMIVRAVAVKVEEAHIERAQVRGFEIGEPMRGGQFEAALILRAAWLRLVRGRQEYRNARHQQSLRQPLHNGVHQSAQVGLRVQAAAEVDQRLAVVEALLVENAVYPRLDHALQWIERSPTMMMAKIGPQQAERWVARMHHLRRNSRRRAK